MAITETLKKLVGKVLSIGTPPEKEVLYKEVIKRKAPQKSAEALVIDDIKNSIKKIWTPEDDIEFARGTANPPVKKAVKKKAPAKKSTSTKKPAAKKPVTKKTTAKTAEAKKTTTTKKSTTTKKASTVSAKKAPAKKASVKKSEESKKTTTTTTTTTAKKTTPSKKTTTKKTTKAAESKTTTATKKPASKKESTKKETTKKAPAKKTVAKKAVTKKSVSKQVETKTETTKKSTTKATTTKKVAAKKPATKKASTSTKKAPVTKGSKRDEKIALYIKDIKKHYGEVDEAFVAIVVKNLGPSIYRKDAELVSCSDPKELDTVRRNFLIKKLGIEASQGVLDAAIQDVCTELKGVRTKYRATFYYALAKKFKKESVLS